MTGEIFMANELIINVTSKEKRIAFVEQGALTELFYERAKATGYAGNIYKGKVQRVLPGMQAAFVELGLEKAAFLYSGDIVEELNNVDTSDDADNGSSKPRRRFDEYMSIEHKLKPGQEILVQVVRGPIGTKGARITSHITLPGRYLVYMPHWDRIGVSKKIGDDNERRRLRQLIKAHRPDYGGIILRTAAEGVDDDEILHDLQLVVDEWLQIVDRAGKVRPPALVQTEIDAVLKGMRDLLSIGLERVVVDDLKEKEKIEKFIYKYIPSWSGIIEYYEDETPIFDYFGIEAEIDRALGKKVWLKSGGYIIIEQTEALSTIDVNTGRFVGSTSLEDTILKTNMEAVEEIVYQLRLRNMGGIIILDLIDMEKRSSREKVYRYLQDELSYDRARTTISKITDLGLIEMTRKRTHESLTRILTEECPCCEGRGFLKSANTVCYELFRHIIREYKNETCNKLILTVYPSVFGALEGEEHEGLIELQKKIGKTIELKLDSSFHPEHYEIVPIYSEEQIEA